MINIENESLYPSMRGSMKNNKYIIAGLLIFLFSGVSGEAISPGEEANFQITTIPAANTAISKTKKQGALPNPGAEDQKALVGAHKDFVDFLRAHANDRLGMVIGRGNVQGIAEERITIPVLKGLSWLFVDPGDAGAVGYLQDNTQDTTQINALATTWPVDFSIKNTFDAVVFDYGTIQYIGYDGSEGRFRGEYFQKQMALVITEAGGTKRSKDSFDAPYKFQDWLFANNPPEQAVLNNYYKPLILAARERQRKTLERGLLDAYLALKRGGVLIIPIDGSVNGIDFVNLLSISEGDLGRHSIASMGDALTESPVLPQLTKGMGTSYSDFYSIIKK